MEENKQAGGEAALRAFTACPTADDVPVYALPFCGPSTAMTHFRFRVKLTPGAMKKASRQEWSARICHRAALHRTPAFRPTPLRRVRSHPRAFAVHLSW